MKAYFLHHAVSNILDEEQEIKNECYLLSEYSLAVDWNRPEEDAAWAHLQAVPVDGDNADTT